GFLANFARNVADGRPRSSGEIADLGRAGACRTRARAARGSVGRCARSPSPLALSTRAARARMMAKVRGLRVAGAMAIGIATAGCVALLGLEAVTYREAADAADVRDPEVVQAAEAATEDAARACPWDTPFGRPEALPQIDVNTSADEVACA